MLTYLAQNLFTQNFCPICIYMYVMCHMFTYTVYLLGYGLVSTSDQASCYTKQETCKYMNFLYNNLISCHGQLELVLLFASTCILYGR